MLTVVEAIEGPIRLNVCLGADRGCTRQEWCPAHDVWMDAQDAVSQVLRGSTITELAERTALLKAEPPLSVLG
jgi:DNA-binding IscR family transcriptional regulator